MIGRGLVLLHPGVTSSCIKIGSPAGIDQGHLIAPMFFNSHFLLEAKEHTVAVKPYMEADIVWLRDARRTTCPTKCSCVAKAAMKSTKTLCTVLCCIITTLADATSSCIEQLNTPRHSTNVLSTHHKHLYIRHLRVAAAGHVNLHSVVAIYTVCHTTLQPCVLAPYFRLLLLVRLLPKTQSLFVTALSLFLYLT